MKQLNEDRLPRVEVTIGYDPEHRNKLHVIATMFVDGRKITTKGYGATLDEAWDWARNSMVAKSGYDYDAVDLVFGFADVQWPLL